MTLKSKIPLFLIAVLVLIGIAWIHRPMKLLVPTSTVKVIYAEGEGLQEQRRGLPPRFQGRHIICIFPMCGRPSAGGGGFQYYDDLFGPPAPFLPLCGISSARTPTAFRSTTALKWLNGAGNSAKEGRRLQDCSITCSVKDRDNRSRTIAFFSPALMAVSIEFLEI